MNSKIQIVADRVPCRKHSAVQGIPCWAWYGGITDSAYIGVCGDRISKVFNGRIQAKSVGNKRPKAA